MKKSLAILTLLLSTCVLGLSENTTKASANINSDKYKSHGMIVNNYGAHTSIKKAKIMTPVYGSRNVFNHSHISYFIYTKNRYYRGIWKSAIKLWNKSPYIHLKESYKENTSNIILGTAKNSPNHSNFIGLTEPYVGNDSKIFSESKVFTNVAKTYKYSRQSTVLVATHELGHDLGLAHSPLHNSVMYYKTRFNSPTKADYKAIKYLYKNKPAYAQTITHTDRLF